MTKLETDAREFLSNHVEDFERTLEHYPYSLPMRAEAYTAGIRELKDAVVNSGSHFFDRDALRFFNGKVAPRVIGGRFFITSEQMDDNSPREYSVRWVYKSPTSEMLQIDRFTDRFDSLVAARTFAYHAHEVLPFPAT